MSSGDFDRLHWRVESAFRPAFRASFANSEVCARALARELAQFHGWPPVHSALERPSEFFSSLKLEKMNSLEKRKMKYPVTSFLAAFSTLSTLRRPFCRGATSSALHSDAIAIENRLTSRKFPLPVLVRRRSAQRATLCSRKDVFRCFLQSFLGNEETIERRRDCR